jgi:excisionase family DNA binding protein
MTSAFIRSLISLVQAGWRPYNYAPRASVYKKLQCPHADTKRRTKPFWFVRGDIFTCVTCSKGCTLSRPDGFYLPLPIQFSEKPETPFTLTPDEMVSHKALLRVDEAAYCLNISERQVYKWIYEGKLRRVKGNPIRVAAEDVSFWMKDYEE